MIINFPIVRARRVMPTAIEPTTEGATAPWPARRVRRWVADPAGGKPHAGWEPPATEQATAVRQANPGRLRVAA